MAVKTPKYWEDKKVFGEMIEVETVNGNKVKIPERFKNGWETAVMAEEHARKFGRDLKAGLKEIEMVNPISYDLERVFYEIYQEED